MKNYIDSCFQKFETNFSTLQKNMKEENENLQNNIQSIKEIIDVLIFFILD